MQLNNRTPAMPNIGCRACADETALSFDFTMAFQPIVDIRNKTIFAQEALVRGLHGESAGSVIAKAHENNLYKFDQNCRIKAVELAAKLNVESFLSINFLPNAVYRPENCLRTTIKTATENNFPLDKIIFEITEVEQVRDDSHLKNIVSEYRRHGFKTAIDDFGAGYSGLNLLSIFQPDFIKLDMELIRDIDKFAVKQTLVKAVVTIAADLGITLIAEGVETKNELDVLENFGIDLFQGYYFAKPSFESLAPITDEVFNRQIETLCIG